MYCYFQIVEISFDLLDFISVLLYALFKLFCIFDPFLYDDRLSLIIKHYLLNFVSTR